AFSCERSCVDVGNSRRVGVDCALKDLRLGGHIDSEKLVLVRLPSAVEWDLRGDPAPKISFLIREYGFDRLLHGRIQTNTFGDQLTTAVATGGEKVLRHAQRSPTSRTMYSVNCPTSMVSVALRSCLLVIRT